MSQIKLSGNASGAGVFTIASPATATDRTINLPDTSTPMASQDAASVDINGGTIDGTVIGGTTAAAGSFTTVTGTSDASINGLTVGRGAGNGAASTAVGSGALVSNTSSGVNDTASGYRALYSNTTGTNNTASGSQALYSNTTGSLNVASGRDVLYHNTTGFNNTASGVNALLSNTTGAYNTAYGRDALNPNTTGSYNIGVGHAANSTSATVSGECTLGDGNITNLRCNDTSISSLSDARDKTEIVDSPYGLAFINTVKPRQFKWQSRDGNAKDGRTHLGFIAQELLEATDGNNAVLNLVTTENPEKLEADYGKLLPIAIKAIQELSAKVAALEAQLNQGN
jgi:hypothetical protein